MTSLWRVAAAVLRKDLRCVLPAVLLAVAVFGGDVILMRLELWPVWESVRQPLVLLSAALLVFAVFQLDSPVSLVDDWLCRPVPRSALLLAKGGLVLGVIYGARAVATLAVDAAGRHPLGETLHDAFLLQDEFFLLVLAVLWMIGITTRTTIQAIGALLGVFLVLIALPGPFMPPVGPLHPAVGESLMANGMAWMASAPAKFLAVAGVAVCCLLVYSLRRPDAARIWVAACGLAGLAAFIMPMGYVPWSGLASAQAAALPSPPEGSPDLARVSLLSGRACFPATRLASAGDGAFGAMLQAARLRWWTEDELRGAGPRSVAFVTSVSPRGLPREWRADLLYVQASVQGEDGRRIGLRPTTYTPPGEGAFTHAWLLPDPAFEGLQGGAARAPSFRYTFAVLEPRRHRVPLGEGRHRLEGLGYCGARRVAAGASIEVDCLVTSPRVAQVSAELPRIGPSAAYGPVDYSPAWMRTLRTRRVRLTLPSARLSTANAVDVVAWHPAGLLERDWQASAPSGSSDACALPDPLSPAQLQASRWRDAAPHETQLVAVDGGVSLEVLDFGGEGPPLLLIPGLGATAHTFDSLGPRLAAKHRVFAMTRRGAGGSSRVDFGYDTPRLARDILGVLDALQIPRATLVGSSIAGDELTWLGGHHPERVAGVVYLDAAYDRSVRDVDARLHDLQLLLPPEPPMREQDFVDYDAFRARQAWRRAPALPEGELIAFHSAGRPFIAGTPDIDPRVAAAIPAALQRPDYRALKVPVLAMYATLDESAALRPWFDPEDAQQMRALREIAAIIERRRRESIEQLRGEAPDATIVEIKGADHVIFVSHEREVVAAIERFVAQKVAR